MKKLLTVLSTIIAISTQAKSVQLSVPAKMRKNVIYLLTEKRAKVLNLDLAQIGRDLSLQKNELVGVYLDNEHELNLSIFDEESFKLLAMDIVK